MKAELRLYVQQLEQQLNIRRKVQVWISEYIDTPMVMGFLKPTILIPIACINQLSVKQLEAILLHELAHIKRNDYLVNLCIAIMEILFFFNPFARFLVKSIKQEREKSCDDWVLQFRFEPYQYASALLTLEKSRSATFSLVMGAAGDNKNFLLQRVQRIMGIKKAYPESSFKLIGYFITIGLLAYIASVNPGDPVVQNFESNKSAQVSMPLPAVSSERTLSKKTVSLSQIIAPAIKIKKKRNEVQLSENNETSGYDSEEDLIALPVSENINDQPAMPQLALLQSDFPENRNFSIKEKEPELPEEAIINDYPFVPSSSYSFYSTQDNTLTKIWLKNNELSARKSIALAQKAIDKIDLDKIARLQKLGKSATLTLKLELRKSLQDINWSQLYNESMDSVYKESMESIKSSLEKEYQKVNNYKCLEQQYQSLKIQLQQQEERIKNQVKKKVVVYI
jgi:hypothetical protein